MTDELKDLNMKDKVDKLVEYFLKEEEKKKFKLPIKFRLQKMLFSRRQYVLVLFIRTNGSIKIKKVKPEDNTVKIGDTIYDASADFVLRYKRYPMMIIFEWNMKPLSPAENFKEAQKDGTLTSTEKVIMAKMEKDAIKGKFNFNWTTILIILGIIVGGIFALNKFGIIK